MLYSLKIRLSKSSMSLAVSATIRARVDLCALSKASSNSTGLTLDSRSMSGNELRKKPDKGKVKPSTPREHIEAEVQLARAARRASWQPPPLHETGAGDPAGRACEFGRWLRRKCADSKPIPCEKGQTRKHTETETFGRMRVVRRKRKSN